MVKKQTSQNSKTYLRIGFLFITEKECKEGGTVPAHKFKSENNDVRI